MFKVILILDKFFLKYKGGSNWPSPAKTTFEKPSLIRVNHKAWLKPYIEMNTKLGQKLKNNFENDFFKLMNNAVFGKTIENVRKNRDVKLLATERRRNYLVSEPNYHTTEFFIKSLLAVEMKNLRYY